MKKLYRAKSIIIGKVENTEDQYFLDIVDTLGNQQTVVSGCLKYVKKYVSKIIFI